MAYPHLPRHDLESSYWVLLWVVLRHTHCCLHWKKKPGKLVCADLFKPLNDSYVGHALKLTSLLRTYYDSLDVASNDPLTRLIARLRALAPKQTLAMYTAMYTDDSEVSSTLKVYLTHHNVLQIFDEVLKLDGWPENDWIPCNVGDDHEPPQPEALRSPPCLSLRLVRGPTKRYESRRGRSRAWALPTECPSR